MPVTQTLRAARIALLFRVPTLLNIATDIHAGEQREAACNSGGGVAALKLLAIRAIRINRGSIATRQAEQRAAQVIKQEAKAAQSRRRSTPASGAIASGSVPQSLATR